MGRLKGRIGAPVLNWKASDVNTLGEVEEEEEKVGELESTLGKREAMSASVGALSRKRKPETVPGYVEAKRREMEAPTPCPTRSKEGSEWVPCCRLGDEERPGEEGVVAFEGEEGCWDAEP